MIPAAAKLHLDAQRLSTTMDSATLPVAKGAYSAKNGQPIDAKKVHSLEWFKSNPAFRYVEWDGRCDVYRLEFFFVSDISIRTPMVVADKHDRIVTVLCGRPCDSDFTPGQLLAPTLLAAGQTTRFSAADISHRRGNFPAKATGISYGNGMQEPARLDEGEQAEMLGDMRSDPGIAKAAAYQSCES